MVHKEEYLINKKDRKWFFGPNEVTKTRRRRNQRNPKDI
jgi:hypothetical protein